MSSKSLLLDHSKSNYEQPALSLPPAVPAYRSSRNPEPLAEGGNGSDRDTSQWLEGSLADTVSPESEPFLANDNHGFNNLNAHKRAASDLGSAEQNNSAPLEEGRKGDGIANAVVYVSSFVITVQQFLTEFQLILKPVVDVGENCAFKSPCTFNESYAVHICIRYSSV